MERHTGLMCLIHGSKYRKIPLQNILVGNANTKQGSSMGISSIWCSQEGWKSQTGYNDVDAEHVLYKDGFVRYKGSHNRKHRHGPVIALK